MNQERTEKPEKRSWKRILLWSFGILFSLLCIGVIVIFSCYRAVSSSSEGFVYDDVMEIPKNSVGLVLGTGKYLKNGKENPFYTYRMDATAALYHAGKLEFIIVSGDNHDVDYNEPKQMYDDLVARGVPWTVIFMDYAGFRTLDSIVRAKKVFKQNKMTIISQEFHNERALYLAHWYGIEAIAFNANDVENRRMSVRNYGREALARVKLFLDLAFDVKPKFLGEEIPVGE